MNTSQILIGGAVLTVLAVAWIVGTKKFISPAFAQKRHAFGALLT